MSGDNKVSDFRSKSDQVKKATSHRYAGYGMDQIGDELDDRVTFRVNSKLKEMFEKVCSNGHSTISRELKRYMTEAVRQNDLL
jgi:hypothetical protein